MSSQYRGHHRTTAPVRSLTTARVSTALVVTGGLAASIAAPADSAVAVGTLQMPASAPVAAPALVAATSATSAAATAALQVVHPTRVTVPELVHARDLVRAAQVRRATSARAAATQAATVSTARAKVISRSAHRSASPTTSIPERKSRPSVPRKAEPSRTSPRTSEVPTAPASGRRAAVIAIAKRYIGTPYSYGGSTPRAFDCSGYTSYVFRQLGVNLPRSARAQQAFASRVSTPQVGDLVFYNFPATHVSIYVGNGKIIDSSKPGTTISIHKIWGKNVSYGRVL